MATLEEKVNEAPWWDSMASAYSASKAVKILLAGIDAGYNYLSCVSIAGGLYLGLKSLFLCVKYLASFATNPFKNYDISLFLAKNKEWYNPLWLPRPHAIGGTLSATTYLTGF